MGIARKKYYFFKFRESAQPLPFFFIACFLYLSVYLVLFLTPSLFVFLQEDTRKRHDGLVKKLLDVQRRREVLSSRYPKPVVVCCFDNTSQLQDSFLTRAHWGFSYRYEKPLFARVRN